MKLPWRNIRIQFELAEVVRLFLLQPGIEAKLTQVKSNPLACSTINFYSLRLQLVAYKLLVARVIESNFSKAYSESGN